MQVLDGTGRYADAMLMLCWCYAGAMLVLERKLPPILLESKHSWGWFLNGVPDMYVCMCVCGESGDGTRCYVVMGTY